MAPLTVGLTCRRLVGRAAVGEERAEVGTASRIRNLHASGEVRVRRSDGLALAGDRLDVDVLEQVLRLEGSPARLSRRKKSPGDTEESDPVESARADWLVLSREDGVIALDIAPHAVVVFELTARQVGDPAARKGNPEDPRRVQIRTGEHTRLLGPHLLTEGGVETTALLPEGRIQASSERLELTFDRSPLEGGMLLSARARRDVSLDHPWFKCTGSLLAFDFEGEWLELKSGLEPCHVIGESALLPLAMDGLEATFHLLKCRLRSKGASGADTLPLDDLLIEDLTLRPRQAVAADR